MLIYLETSCSPINHNRVVVLETPLREEAQEELCVSSSCVSEYFWKTYHFRLVDGVCGVARGLIDFPGSYFQSLLRQNCNITQRYGLSSHQP